MTTSGSNENYRLWYVALIGVLVVLIVLFTRFTHFFS